MGSVCHFETSAKNYPKMTLTITRSKTCHMFYYFESQFSFVLRLTVFEFYGTLHFATSALNCLRSKYTINTTMWNVQVTHTCVTVMMPPLPFNATAELPTHLTYFCTALMIWRQIPVYQCTVECWMQGTIKDWRAILMVCKWLKYSYNCIIRKCEILPPSHTHIQQYLIPVHVHISIEATWP